ncbi:DUF916 and DUF3324 domain-containing protein [Enterococcus faecalis]|uniref:DUF916 and DUF3324 domain-containing protein n=1 Tax=Enterococcus faecalis TaxID=1351 RepID=UPI0031CCED81
MKLFIQFFLGNIICLLGLVAFQHISYASSVDYSVQAVPSEYQQNKDVTYFDLRIKPKENRKLFVDVKNSSDQSIRIDTFVDKATTNSNGVVEYKNSSKFKSCNLKYDISEIVIPETTNIILAAHETRRVGYNIKMPNNDFDGQIVGGINFIQNNPRIGENDSNNSSNMAIKNQYAYTISVVLHGEKELHKNDVDLGQIKANQINGRNSIQVPIHNKTAAFLNKVQVEALVRDANNQSIIYKDKKSGGQIAPNSVYNFELNTNLEKLKPGNYIAVLKLISKEQRWKFEQEFSIKASESEKLNKNAIIKKKNNPVKYIMLGTIMILLFIIMISYIIFKKNKKIKELDKQLKNNRNE